jgi:NodT family efflux transporter outer membrane factor (OMF) lipoprotein
MACSLRVNNIAAAIAAGLLLCGCAVGPDFRRPEAPNTDSYTSTQLPGETSAAPGIHGGAQKFVIGQDIPEQWWSLFQSEPLDKVIRMALSDSPTLAAAEATLRVAQENLRARSGTVFFPSVDAGFSAERQKFSGAAFGQAGAGSNIFNLYNASVSVSYSLDIFGGGRRELEALKSQVDYQRFQLEGAYLALTSNIVTTVVKEVSLRAQIQATREILTAQEKQLAIVGRQFDLGSISFTDVLAQRTLVAQTAATLPPLEKQLAQARHQLAVLAGRVPAGAELPEFYLDQLQLPLELPVTLPSSLVLNRPDIKASEAFLHAASAQVGVATANLFPKITLTGSYGSETLRLSDLFGSGTSVWNLGGALVQPLFHGGELRAKRRASIAAYDQALALYKETVLLAFQNVADALRALDFDAKTLKAQADAEAAAHDTLALTQKQFELGAVSYLALLNAERQYQQTRINLAQAQAARFADTAALFQALGGGWWNRTPQADRVNITVSETHIRATKQNANGEDFHE